jgi:hypothetical protein
VKNAPNRDPISGSGHRIDIAVEFVEREGSCSRENVTLPRIRFTSKSNSMPLVKAGSRLGAISQPDLNGRRSFSAQCAFRPIQYLSAKAGGRCGWSACSTYRCSSSFGCCRRRMLDIRRGDLSRLASGDITITHLNDANGVAAFT